MRGVCECMRTLVHVMWNLALQFLSCPLDAAPNLRDGAHSMVGGLKAEYINPDWPGLYAPPSPKMGSGKRVVENG
jgi:hypothetical protein